jgi:hypothetical protein
MHGVKKGGEKIRGIHKSGFNHFAGKDNLSCPVLQWFIPHGPDEKPLGRTPEAFGNRCEF